MINYGQLPVNEGNLRLASLEECYCVHPRRLRRITQAKIWWQSIQRGRPSHSHRASISHVCLLLQGFGRGVVFDVLSVKLSPPLVHRQLSSATTTSPP